MLGSEKAAWVADAIAAVEAGQRVEGPWLKLAKDHIAGKSIAAEKVWSALKKHIRQGNRSNQ